MDLVPTCPAAFPLDGPPDSGPSILCRALEDEGERTDSIVEGDVAGRLRTTATDISIVSNLCCGDFMSCPVWRKERERDLARRRRLLPRVEPDPRSVYPFGREPASGGPRSPEESFDDPAAPREWAE